jgi:hypothetical protein
VYVCLRARMCFCEAYLPTGGFLLWPVSCGLLNRKSKACHTFSPCVGDFPSWLFLWDWLFGEAQSLLWRDRTRALIVPLFALTASAVSSRL